MPMQTTIKVHKETRTKLMKLKYDLGSENLDELLESMIKICQKVKTANKKGWFKRK